MDKNCRRDVLVVKTTENRRMTAASRPSPSFRQVDEGQPPSSTSLPFLSLLMSVLGPSLRSIASPSFSALARRPLALASSSRLPATAVASFRRSSSTPIPPPPPPPPPSPTTKPQKPLELPRLKDEPTQDQARTRGLVGVSSFPHDEVMQLGGSGRGIDDHSLQVFDWKTALIFVSVGGGLYFYFENEKAKVAELKGASGASGRHFDLLADRPTRRLPSVCLLQPRRRSGSQRSPASR